MDKLIMVKNQIAALIQIVGERGIDFDGPSQDEMDKMSKQELDVIRRNLHELAYAPPSKR